MGENTQVRFTVDSDLVARTKKIKAALGLPADTYVWSVAFGLGVRMLEESIKDAGAMRVSVGSEELESRG